MGNTPVMPRLVHDSIPGTRAAKHFVSRLAMSFALLALRHRKGKPERNAGSPRERYEFHRRAPQYKRRKRAN